MKREILFRGFHPDENGTQIAVVNGKEHKGEWIDGYFFKIWHEYYILWGTTNGIPNMLEVLPETVCEWTGLTDKNGKKMFEHDRIRYKCGELAEVIFTEYGAFVGETESLSHENIGGVLTEVIGTIFDKEEL
jgi:hypothetical protein